MRLRFLCCFLCLAAAFVCPLQSRAQSERILDYHSDITVREDGSMVVAETIRVNCEHEQIRHGIYRDFPTRYTDRIGNRYVVAFQFIDATRDSAPETWRLEDLDNGKRIYLGSNDYLLPLGEHVYTLTYSTSRQMGFFKDHDELFWNVTGNGWMFVIDHASALVHLPATIPNDAVHLNGFTGVKGSMARDFRSWEDSGNRFSFAANHALSPREGLTILLMWLKGYFAEPTKEEKLEEFFSDNRDSLIMSVGLATILLYYLIVWAAVGRDPERGVIVPLYDAPEGMSPAAMRYLVHMGWDNKAFTCAILDMAVKGFLQIRWQAGSYTLYLAKGSRDSLSTEGKSLADRLFDGRSFVWLHNENHVAISAAMADLKAKLKTAEEKLYFLTNSRYMIPAAVASVATILIVVASSGPSKLAIVGFMAVWLTIWTGAVAALIIGVLGLWRTAFEGGHLKAASLSQAVFMSLFSLPFLAGECLGFFLLAKATSVFVVAALIAMILLHIVFHYLLKAPTSAGRKILDKIEGFKMFLGAVDGDRLNRAFSPEQKPEVFEKFLPYALALGVEQAWAQKFSGILDSASHAPGSGSATGYSPVWYSGAAWNSLGTAGLAGALSGSFSSAISSSSTAPGSGGGGGGGGSGGGGGGGGGGGW